MPPTKRTGRRLKVGLTHLDEALLQATRDAMGGTLADHVRFAIRYYAKHNPHLDSVDWLAFAAREIEPEIDSPEEVGRFRAELKSWRDNDLSIPSSSVEDTATGTLPEQSMEFASGDWMFDDLD